MDIENRTGGSVGFTAPISDTDQGILLNSNGTAPVLFLGGLTLNTGAERGDHRDQRRPRYRDAGQHLDRQHDHDDDRNRPEPDELLDRHVRLDVPQHLVATAR